MAAAGMPPSMPHSRSPRPPPPPPSSLPASTASAASPARSRPPPPPPPPPPAAAAVDHRRRGLVPSIQTTLAAAAATAGPSSAHPATAPYSPMPTSARGVSPMAVRSAVGMVSAYNPQEWSPGHPGASNFTPHTPSPGAANAPGALPATTRDVTGHEAALPSPPPPYSASPATPGAARSFGRSAAAGPSSRSTSNTQSGYTSPNSAATSTSSTGFPGHYASHTHHLSNSSNQQPSPTNYPPPPPASARDRSGSRSRTIFAALTSRARGYDNSIEALQQQTNEALARTPLQSRPTAVTISAALYPPGARRAASTGCIGPRTDSLPDGDGVNHGFALPPPPPGPPPAGLRSRSLNRTSEVADPTQPFPRRTAASSQLGPVPPTPADWVDDSAQQDPIPPLPGQADHSITLHGGPNDYADSSALLRSRLGEPQRTNSNSSGGGSIRERRSQSRANRGVRTGTGEPQTAIEQTSDPWAAGEHAARPANLVLASPNGNLARRAHVAKSKTSPLFRSTLTPEAGRARQNSDSSNNDNVDLGGSASLPGSARAGMEPTPPFSAGNEHARGPAKIIPADKGLPTPPSRGGQYVDSPRILSARSTGSEDTSSSIPSRSNSAAGKRPASSTTSLTSSFGRSSMERFQQFLEQEEAVGSDRERLELFASFIVFESRLRRDLYADAFESLGGDALELTRDMWKPLVAKRAKTPSHVASPLAGRTTPKADRDATQEPGSATSSTHPRTDTSSPGFHPIRRPESRQNTYQPQLSPIPSMAMSTAYDDHSSRGRAPSRWWEASTHTGSVGGGRRVERSKRESKYMGVPKSARENMQWEYAQPSPGQASSSFQAGYGPTEYPPEKVGWHEEVPSPAPTPQSAVAPRRVNTPTMDVSRLITLPPPYPRHHPAVNNSHPDLTHIRTTLRNLAERTESAEAMEHFNGRPQPAALTPQALQERKRDLRRHIQTQVANGSMSFAEAAKQEAEFDERESRAANEGPQKEFEDFQRMVRNVVTPVFESKIHSASASIEMLAESLNESLRSYDPNQTQEEGDEKPELLEKLTLMKWLFEAREQLHRDLFELEGQSDQKYMQVILTPYAMQGQQDKIAEVEAFFVKDTRDRQVQYEAKSAKRYESFLHIVEKNVTRGAEVQLSAFWDIAPSLLEIVQRVPRRLDSFEVGIPAEEFDENPSYVQHPTQYLYSVLLHAEKSAYQFIESQINLMCLLHEVRSGVMTTGSKLLELERLAAGEDTTAVAEEMQAARGSEDQRLTHELKERVELVEGQWREALGEGIQDCRERIKAFLVSRNGWDDSLDE